MPWWAWIVMGAVLLGAEVALATDFYLVFFGLAALLVGLLGLMGLSLPAGLQWLVFGALAVVALVAYRQRLRDRLSRPEKELDEELVGKTAVAREDLAPGGSGRVEVRGTSWRGLNQGEGGV